MTGKLRCASWEGVARHIMHSANVMRCSAHSSSFFYRSQVAFNALCSKSILGGFSGNSAFLLYCVLCAFHLPCVSHEGDYPVTTIMWAHSATKLVASNIRERLPLAGESCNSLMFKMPPCSGPGA